MALSDSGRAIGAVTRLLQAHLMRNSFAVSIGPPRAAAADTQANNKLNLFLFQADFDASLRNISLLANQPPPLWLSLRYLITAFDSDNLSDTAEAHQLLGLGMSALNQLNYLRLDAGLASDIRLALENNPEPLKITFEEASADLLSKLMQGSEDNYRLSSAFQVRPVLIVPDTPPDLSLLVGIDYTQTPLQVIGRDGVGLAVLAGIGPRLSEAVPAAFEAGASFEVLGEDLHLSGLECRLSGVPLNIVERAADHLGLIVDGVILTGTAVSAGEHVLQVRQLLPNQRYRVSNLITARLLPVLSGATLAAGTLMLDGLLLGNADDDVLIAFHRDGITIRVFDSAMTSADQTQLTVTGIASEAAPELFTPGDYRIVLLVNGQQAHNSPTVTVP